MKGDFQKILLTAALLVIALSICHAFAWTDGPCPNEGKGPLDGVLPRVPLKADIQILACGDQAQESKVGQTGQSRQIAPGSPEPISASPPPGVPEERERDAILERGQSTPAPSPRDR